MAYDRLSDCPECRLPATVTPWGTATGTDGSVLHVYVRCVLGHWFLGPVETVVTTGDERNVTDADRSGR
jgi:hypothetical protein